MQNGTSGKEIYGFVLVDDEASTVTTASDKSPGWNSSDDLETYDTYNITITKNITGPLADLTAGFPFTVTLTGEMNAANIATDGTGENITNTSGTVTGTLGNGNTMIIKGLPTTVSFTVAEDNPMPDTYTTTATVTGVTGTTNASSASLTGNVKAFSVVSDGATSNATDKIEITVENHLDVISPTGVVLRITPYVLMLGAGIMLFVLSRKRRNAVED